MLPALTRGPSEITLVRHAESTSNVLLRDLHADILYSQFKEVLKKNPDARKAKRLALKLIKKYRSQIKPDHSVEITEFGKWQAEKTGLALKKLIKPPQVILFSPYTRTVQTIEHIEFAWPGILDEIEVYEKEDELREQGFGSTELFVDFRLFFALNPKERALHKADEYAHYYYRFPGGESIADMRQRVNGLMHKIMYECEGKRVLIVGHNGSLFACRGYLEKWDFRKFIEEHDNTGVVPNCAVTTYVNHSYSLWKPDMKLEIEPNRQFWNL